MVKKINAKEFKEEAVKGLALVDFSAVWCGPCKMMAPVLEDLSDELEGKMNFFNVDCDENMMLAMKYQISSIPCLVILQDGKQIGKIVGFRPMEELKPEIMKYID